MDREAWIMAAWLVQRHGADAFRAIESAMDMMRRDCADEDQLRQWCWVARAVIELTRLEPRAAEAVH